MLQAYFVSLVVALSNSFLFVFFFISLPEQQNSQLAVKPLNEWLSKLLVSFIAGSVPDSYPVFARCVFLGITVLALSLKAFH